MRICIAGATGFVGSKLIDSWKSDESKQIIALTRRDISQVPSSKHSPNCQWRKVDSYSLPELEEAVKDCDTLIYLIHSMLPSATLLQGEFWEFDAYLADNFARTAAKAGIKRIVYLGGLIPESTELSNHLSSRMEVEMILRSYGTKLTVLRAGLVVGKGGSSFRIMEKLVRRLPIMVCPSWTSTLSQPIDVENVIEIISCTIASPTLENRTFDIGGPDQLTYQEMLRLTANELGRKIFFLQVPFLSPALSRLWVSTITGTPRSLAYPLIDSLRHRMLVSESSKYDLGNNATPFKESLRRALTSERGEKFSISNFLKLGLSFQIHKDVRSIQRYDNNHKFSAREVMEAYVDWLPTFLRFIITTRRVEDRFEFRLLSLITLLQLTMSKRSSEERCVLYVTGGLLLRKPAYKKGRLEFREILNGKYILCHLQDFRPSLPWFIYKYSQAIVHLFVIHRFFKWLDSK